MEQRRKLRKPKYYIPKKLLDFCNITCFISLVGSLFLYLYNAVICIKELLLKLVIDDVNTIMNLKYILVASSIWIFWYYFLSNYIETKLLLVSLYRTLYKYVEIVLFCFLPFAIVKSILNYTFIIYLLVIIYLITVSLLDSSLFTTNKDILKREEE